MYKLEYTTLDDRGISSLGVMSVSDDKLVQYFKEFKGIMKESKEWRRLTYEYDGNTLISLRFAYQIDNMKKSYVFTKERS